MFCLVFGGGGGCVVVVVNSRSIRLRFSQCVKRFTFVIINHERLSFVRTFIVLVENIFALMINDKQITVVFSSPITFLYTPYFTRPQNIRCKTGRMRKKI